MGGPGQGQGQGEPGPEAEAPAPGGGLAVPALAGLVAGVYERSVLGFDLAGAAAAGGEGAGEGGGAPLRRAWAAPAHRAPVRCLAAGGSLVASGGDDDLVRLFDVAQRKDVGTLTEAGGGLNDLCFHVPRGRAEPTHLLGAGQDGVVNVWGTKNELRHLLELRGHQGPCAGVTVHESGLVGLSVGRDRTLVMWDLAKGRASYRKKLAAAAEGVRFARAGDLFFLRYPTHAAVHLAEDDRRSFALPHPARLLCLAQASRGAVVTGAEDAGLRVWDLAGRRVVAEVPRAHARRIKGVAVPASGGGEEGGRHGLPRLLASASSDGAVKVWDTRRLGAGAGPLYEAAARARITCLCATHPHAPAGAAPALAFDPPAATAAPAAPAERKAGAGAMAGTAEARREARPGKKKKAKKPLGKAQKKRLLKDLGRFD